MFIHQALLDIAEKNRCRYPYNVPTQIIPFVKKTKTTSFDGALLIAVGKFENDNGYDEGKDIISMFSSKSVQIKTLFINNYPHFKQGSPHT